MQYVIETSIWWPPVAAQPISKETSQKRSEIVGVAASLPMEGDLLHEKATIDESRAEEKSSRRRRQAPQQFAAIMSMDRRDAPQACEEDGNEWKMSESDGHALGNAVSDGKERAL